MRLNRAMPKCPPERRLCGSSASIRMHRVESFDAAGGNAWTAVTRHRHVALRVRAEVKCRFATGVGGATKENSMTLPADFAHELSLLLQYDADNSQTGLKVHHDAAPEVIAAAQRLFEKGLVSQHDGGYLTKLGQDAALHLQSVRSILG